MDRPLWKQNIFPLKKLKIELPHDPAVPLLFIYLKQKQKQTNENHRIQ